MFTGENAVQSNLLYRGYQLEVRRAPSGWRVGIYPRTADLPILSRCEVIAVDQHEALVMAKHRVDGVIFLLGPLPCLREQAHSAACFPR